MNTSGLTLLAAMTFAVCTPAAAQQLGERIPGMKSDTPANHLPSGRSVKTKSNVRACPEYGAGFVRVEGSNTCMRAGGKVIYEYGMTGGRRSDGAPLSGSRAAFAPEIETRTQTEMGPFHMVVRGAVVRDTGGHVGAPFR